MSVTVRPYVDGGWEVDIRVPLLDGSVLRERGKAPTASKSAAQRWAESRERVLLVNGKPDRAKEVQQKTTVREFAPRFIEGHAKANRLKERHRIERVRAANPPRAGAGRQAAGGDHDRGRATAQVSPQRAFTEDGEQHLDGAECADADCSRVERNRSSAVFDQAAANAENRSGVLRLRAVRGACCSGGQRTAGAINRPVGRRGRPSMRRDDRAR